MAHAAAQPKGTLPQQALAALKTHRILAAFAAILLIGGGIYVSGYRLGPGFTIARLGVLQLVNVPAGDQVFVDYGLRGVTAGGTYPIALMPGTHNVIINETGSYPWEEIVTVGSNQTTPIKPLLVKKAGSRLQLSGDLRAAALSAIASTTLPSEAAPLSMGCANIYVAGNRIIAAPATSTPGCTDVAYACSNGACSPTIVYAPSATITAVLPYPGRTDALAAAVGGHLYAIEIDPRTPQTFAPIYDGFEVKAATSTGDGLYVFDDGVAYQFRF